MAAEVSFIPDCEAARRAGMSVATIWRKVKAGEFPTPVRIGRRTLWRSDEVTQWIERETNAYRAGRRSLNTARVPRNGGRRRSHNVAEVEVLGSEHITTTDSSRATGERS